MYTVKRAAELTGIAADTLRMWERRYGVVSPARTAGGYRVYDDAAVRRLAAMKALVDSGWAARQAARRVLEDASGGVDVPGLPAARVMGDTAALWRAGRTLDGPGLDGVLDEAFALGSFEQVVDAWLMPSLQRLGAAWRDGDVGVAGEHFVSAGVQRRLAALFDAAGGRPSAGPAVVVGLAHGSHHELGVLAFATALRRAGPSVVYLGADLPPAGWAAAVRSGGAAAAVLGVPTSEDVPAVRETLDVLAGADGGLPVYVGGGHQAEVGGAARPLGHGVGPAARELAASLGARPGSGLSPPASAPGCRPPAASSAERSPHRRGR